MKHFNVNIFGDVESLSHFDFGSELFRFDSESDSDSVPTTDYFDSGFDEKTGELFEREFCSEYDGFGSGFDEPSIIFKNLKNPINYSKNIQILECQYPVPINYSESAYRCIALKSYETIVALYFIKQDTLISIRNMSRSTNNHIRLFERYIDSEYSWNCNVQINLSSKWEYSDSWY